MFEKNRVLMKNPEKVIEEEFERVKKIVGEEKAKIYFQSKDNFNFKATTNLISIHSLKKLVKQKPYAVVVIAIIIVIILLIQSGVFFIP